jgi:hypothetical protein
MTTITINVCSQVDMHKIDDMVSLCTLDGLEHFFFILNFLAPTTVVFSDGSQAEVEVSYNEPSPLFFREFVNLYAGMWQAVINMEVCDVCQEIHNARDGLIGGSENFN